MKHKRDVKRKCKRLLLPVLLLLAAISAVFCLSVPVMAESSGVAIEPVTIDGEKTTSGEEPSAAEEILDLVGQGTNSEDIGSITDQLRKYTSPEIEEIIPGLSAQDIIKNSATGKLDLSLKNVCQNALKYLFHEVYANLHILLKLVILIILCAILKNLQTSFMSDSVGEIAFYVCYIVVVSLLLVSFNTAMKLGIEIIDSMTGFMVATMPVLITLLVSGGNLSSGAVFQPAMIMMVEIAATIVKNIFIPLIFLSAVLSIINNISEKLQITRLTGLLKQITGWMLGIILTVFIGVVSIQGSLGAVVDGVTSKTAKFAIGAFIPVAGKYLADAADTVIGCTLLIKNAAGLAVMIGIIAICIVPLLKIVALVLVYKAAGALIEPISDKRMSACINDVSGSMLSVLGIAAAITFMFLITVTAIISAGTMSAMIR